MPASNGSTSPAVPTETATDLRVDCYVRSSVPGLTAETITTIVNRLQQLCDHGHISTYQLHPWPPEQHAVIETDETREPARHELVAEFERWADQHGVTLEPAFRRQEVPSSPLGISADEPRERIRVPLVALALYEDDSAAADQESASLQGVVPYTEQSPTGTAQTYTVDEWLTAVSTNTGEIVTYNSDSHDDHQPLLERQQ
ncbi:HTH domain-containing protein [Natrinema sp. 1APR25-10V2]|uniref:HTH domain-containing protein n=1 Tax=Natrinema sp. 1APR25-10V2 TaxID=2951081 RepID=UPI0028754422|nr:HTH domain-containing protein [Natrinema sp. 1APR25-10V2]MDS0476881.1 hypothetical protein [Natrinema sp. 1APR25-10V2]